MPDDTRATPPGHADMVVRQQFEARIRAAYVHAMRRWVNETNNCTNSTWGSKPRPEMDGGVATNGRRYTSAWSAIAIMLANSNCLDAEGFINANCIAGARPPNPNTLHSQAAMDTYRCTIDIAVPQLKCAFSSQSGAFAVETAKFRRWYPDEELTEIWRMVLVTLSVQISPLFCYCIAADQGFSDVCQQFEELAVSQYMTNPAAYKEAWVDVLPAALVRHCDAMLAAINRGERP